MFKTLPYYRVKALPFSLFCLTFATGDKYLLMAIGHQNLQESMVFLMAVINPFLFTIYLFLVLSQQYFMQMIHHLLVPVVNTRKDLKYIDLLAKDTMLEASKWFQSNAFLLNKESAQKIKFVLKNL